MTRTKIVATLGPNNSSPEIVQGMLNAGVNVFRFNFSHGNQEIHHKLMTLARNEAAKLKQTIAVLADTEGPEVRIGDVADTEIEIKTGQMIKISGENKPSTSEEITIPLFPMLQKYCQTGTVILFDDGKLSVTIKDISQEMVTAEVIDGGFLKKRKKVTIPHVTLPLPILTEKDKDDVKFALNMQADFLALSFVRNKKDIETVRDFILSQKGSIFIIAKIECSEAVENIDEIIEAADGIMVARGDLGVELEPEEVPIIQKLIIKKCNQAGKPVITATQMLESMLDNVRPTRAETTDIANAVFDGSDAVMLSGETATGRYPVLAVKMMSRIILAAEKHYPYEEKLRHRRESKMFTIPDAISHATCQSAWNLKAKAIVSATVSGSTAALISKYRPSAPIIAASCKTETCRRLQLYWGVNSVIIPESHKVEDMIESVENVCTANGMLTKGDLVVFTAGVPLGGEGKTNFIKIHRILEG